MVCKLTSRTVRTNKTRTRLAFKGVHDLLFRIRNDELLQVENIIIATHTNLICLWDSFGNTHNQTNLIFNSFDNGVSSTGWRDIENGCVGFCCGYGLTAAFSSTSKCGLDPEGIHTSLTLPKTGSPRCVCPAFFGDTPPTMLVPYASASLTWKVPYKKDSRLD